MAIRTLYSVYQASTERETRGRERERESEIIWSRALTMTILTQFCIMHCCAVHFFLSRSVLVNNLHIYGVFCDDANV